MKIIKWSIIDKLKVFKRLKEFDRKQEVKRNINKFSEFIFNKLQEEELN